MAVEEADGTTLLDNSMVLYGSGISDGDRHDHVNLPVIVLGKGGGTLRSGQHLKCRPETPMSNLLLAMLQQAGVPVDRFGDSTEPLPGLLLTIRTGAERSRASSRSCMACGRRLSRAVLRARSLVAGRSPRDRPATRRRSRRVADRGPAGRERGSPPGRGGQDPVVRQERATAGVAGADRSADEREGRPGAPGRPRRRHRARARRGPGRPRARPHLAHRLRGPAAGGVAPGLPLGPGARGRSASRRSRGCAAC